jgi:hypothetical protein
LNNVSIVKEDSMGKRRIIKAVALWVGSMLLIYGGFLFTREQVAKDLRRPECWEPTADPWFTAEVTVQPVRLPEGVTITVETSTHGPMPYYSIQMRNSSPVPAYSLQPKSELIGRTIQPPSMALPPLMAINEKVINNTVYVWNTRTQAWQEDPRGDMVVVGFYQPELHPSDDRPPDIAVPAPVVAPFVFLYDQQLITLPTTLTYSLNTQYDPHQAASNPRNLPLCSSLADQNLGGGYGLLLVYLCFWLLGMAAFVSGVNSIVRQLQQL